MSFKILFIIVIIIFKHICGILLPASICWLNTEPLMVSMALNLMQNMCDDGYVCLMHKTLILVAFRCGYHIKNRWQNWHLTFDNNDDDDIRAIWFYLVAHTIIIIIINGSFAFRTLHVIFLMSHNYMLRCASCDALDIFNEE